ncbi:MAG TPA: IMP cyclohydrolase [Clostridiaceae bacterium]
MKFEEISKINLKALKDNSYPGRGIILGLTPDGENYVQIYWIMGRSENSRNRVFLEDEGYVRNRAYDESKVIDPSLIIYYPVKYLDNYHIVTNGDQTDTIYDYLKEGNSFEEAIETRTFEPDGPNFTPRISGIVELDKKIAYKLAINKSINNDGNYKEVNFFNYEKGVPGYGHFLSTYMGDGNPLPSFEGEPKLVNIYNTIEENLKFYWGSLNEDNRISILVKYINMQNKKTELKIINKYEA